jgi:hypothetical protein
MSRTTGGTGGRPQLLPDSLIGCVNASFQEGPPVAWRKNHLLSCHKTLSRGVVGSARRLPAGLASMRVERKGGLVENTLERKKEEPLHQSLNNQRSCTFGGLLEQV